MDDKPETPVKEDQKPPYEPPQIVRLNEIDTAEGGVAQIPCVNGASAVTGFCDAGGAPLQQ